MDTSPLWAMTFGGISLLGGGLACYLLGRKWNRGRGIHTMYWAPLENWGLAYIVIGGLFARLGLGAVIKKWIAG